MKTLAELGWFDPIPPETWWRRVWKAVRRGLRLVCQPFRRFPF